MIFEDFDFSKVVHEHPSQRTAFQVGFVPPIKRIVWGETLEGDVPQRAMSGDSYDLVYHFPGAISQKVRFFIYLEVFPT